MKIAVIGYSGSGKSTLAQFLSEKYNIPVLHLDTVHWLSGWKEQKHEIKLQNVKQFMDENNSWIIDGNYSKLFFERRMAEADKIVFMNFNRFSCLLRVIKRYYDYKGKTRESMTTGCEEKIDFEFVKWVLWNGRTKSRSSLFFDTALKYNNKTVIIKNQHQLTEYKKEINAI